MSPEHLIQHFAGRLQFDINCREHHTGDAFQIFFDLTLTFITFLSGMKLFKMLLQL